MSESDDTKANAGMLASLRRIMHPDAGGDTPGGVLTGMDTDTVKTDDKADEEDGASDGADDTGEVEGSAPQTDPVAEEAVSDEAVRHDDETDVPAQEEVTLAERADEAPVDPDGMVDAKSASSTAEEAENKEVPGDDGHPTDEAAADEAAETMDDDTSVAPDTADHDEPLTLHAVEEEPLALDPLEDDVPLALDEFEDETPLTLEGNEDDEPLTLEDVAEEAEAALPLDSPLDEPLSLDAESMVEADDAAMEGMDTEALHEPADPLAPDEAVGEPADALAREAADEIKAADAREDDAVAEPFSEEIKLSDAGSEADPAMEDKVSLDETGTTEAIAPTPSAEEPREAGGEDDPAPLAPPDWNDEPAGAGAAAAVAAGAAGLGAATFSAQAVDADGDSELEDLIRRIVREELTAGETGQNMSRNVLRLVRQEIEAALSRRNL